MMKKEDIKKVVLAYSGGLDTSIIIPWLKENYNNCEVIAVSGNVGQADELEGLEEKAIKTGASKLYVLDLTDEYVDDYIIPTMQAGAMYEEYLLGTSHARPCIAKGLVEIAQKEGADAIAHGCTGKGNDQVRFELAVKHFAPDMPIIAPWREWDIKSREEEIAYAEAHNVPLKINRETNYSKDKNLWHLSHEGLDLEDPGNEPQYEKKGFLEMGVSPIDAPDAPTYITLDFEQGKPVALDGEKMSAKDIILKLNQIGGANGIGILDIVENRLVGMKCRGVYETPGGTILYKAHSVLETLCLDKMTMHEKQKLAVTFGELVYNGQWFTPLREALSAFVTKTQEHVTGTVRLKLYKGNMINAGVWSPYSLYSEEIATFGETDFSCLTANYANHFGSYIKSRSSLEEILRNVLKIDLKIQDFVTEAYDIPPDCWCQVGNPRTAVLGRNMQIGRTYLSATHEFEIRIGPVPFSECRKWLPGSEGYDRLSRIIMLYLDRPLEYTIRFTIDGETIPFAAFGNPASTQLGRNCWIGRSRGRNKDIILTIGASRLNKKRHRASFQEKGIPS